MSLRTALVIAGDSTGAEKALDATGKAMAGAEKEAADLAAAYGNADKAIDELARAQAEANREIEASKKAFNAGAIGAEQYHREILETKSALSLISAEHRSAMTEMRKASGAYKNAVNDNDDLGDSSEKLAKRQNAAAFAQKNLNFQIMDMGQSIALGMPPMMVLMQQVPQAAGAFADLSTAVGGTGNAVASLVAKFGPAVLVVGVLAGAVALITSEVNENSKVTISWQNVLLGAFDATAAALEGGLKSAFAAFGLSTEDVFGSVLHAAKWTFNGVINTGRVVPVLLIEAFKTFPAAFADLVVSGANAGIRGLNGLVSGAVELVNGYIVKINAAMASVASWTGTTAFKIPTLTAPQISEIKNSYAGAGRAAAGAMVKAFSDTMGTDVLGEIGKAITPFAESRQLKENAAKAGKAAGAGAAKAFGAAGKDAGDEFGKNLLNAIATLPAQMKDMVTAAGKAANQSLDADWNAFIARLNRGGDALVDKLNEAARPAMELREEFALTAEYLERMGGTMGTIGALLRGLTTGDFSGIGGKAGALIDMIGGVQGLRQTDDGKAEAYTLKTLFTEIFSTSGAFGKTMASLLKGAGTGAAVGSMVFDSKGGQLGAMAGGAIGQELGSKFLKGGLESIAKGLGDFAGPLGSIAGSLIGGLLGGVLSKTKKGSATIGYTAEGIGTTSVAGNSGSRKAAASSLGDNIGEILGNIEEQLGLSISGALSTSIGIRKKNYVVDTTGMGRTKGAGTINFGQDEKAAIKAALQDILKDATISGISEGMQSLLRGGDIEKQMQKLLTVKAVFDSVDQRADPIGFAQTEFDKQFAKVKAILDEAGASAEEYAKAETWAAQQRADIVEEGNRAIVEKERDRKELLIAIMAAEGDAAGALAAAHDLERQSTEASLLPLKERLWALQAEAEQAAKAQEIADERYAIETRLLQAMGDTAALQQRDLLLVNEANRARLAEVYAYEAQKAAVAEAAAIAERIADERIAIEEELFAVLGNTVELERRRLEAIDPANRALAEQLTAEKALAAARADAAAQAMAIAQERENLEVRYLQATGDTKALRDREMAGTNEANRDVLAKLFAFEDAKAAAEEAQKQRASLIAGYQAEAQNLGQLADKMVGLAGSIREFRDSVTMGATASDAATAAEFKRVAAMAALGNENALSSFNSTGQAYLASALKSARSQSEYQDAQALVVSAANQAIAGAERIASGAGSQMAALNYQAELLESSGAELAILNDTSSEMAAQLAALADLQSDGVIPAITDTVGAPIEKLTGIMRDVLKSIEIMRSEGQNGAEQRKKLLDDMTGMMRGAFRQNRFNIGTELDQPIAATVSGEVRVNNDATDPVQTEVVP